MIGPVRARVAADHVNDDGPGLRTRPQTWMPAVFLLLGTVAIAWRLVAEPSQFAINDLGPFGSHMLQMCLGSYDNAGLGRANPHTIPSYCDFGLLSMALGGTSAQHLFVIGCFALAGASMFFLLRRIGNPTTISLIGALTYEFSPIMFSFQLGGEGLLFTAALLPAVLLGAIPGPGRSTWVDGVRSGALLALVSYANPQAAAFVILLLVPAVGVTFFGRVPGDARRALLFSAWFVVTFILAAVPVLQILPSFGTMVQASQGALRGDFLTRLASDSAIDFATPYSALGAIPALFGFLLLQLVRDIRPSERAAALSLVSIVLLWEILRHIGSGVSKVLPVITMYKDFIKLEVILAVPFVVMSAMVLRWVFGFRAALCGPVRLALAAGTALLLFVPLVVGHTPRAQYLSDPTTQSSVQAMLSGQLGLPSWSKVPPAYMNVLDTIRQRDPDPRTYRVLWMPIDWRLMQMSRATDMNLLLYWSDASAASRAAILGTFSAVATDQAAQIGPLLADQGVKYVVIDLTDGQDRNNESWQQGPPMTVPIWGTQALIGKAEGYRKILSASPGLSLVQATKGWLIYQNQYWRPILASYSALLAVSGSDPQGSPASSQSASVSLPWNGWQGVQWKEEADNGIWIAAARNQPGQTAWSPVSAVIPVIGGTSYQIGGEMQYEQVIQAHAKVIWHGNLPAADATTYLATGHDGTGVVSLRQSLVAPSGATTAEFLLMGGWSSTGVGFTRYTNVTLKTLTVADLSTLQNHPNNVLSLWHELPDMLIETGTPAQGLGVASMDIVTLRQDSHDTGRVAGVVRLLAADDLVTAGKWSVNAVPDPLGLEHFVNIGGGTLNVSVEALKTAPAGSKLVWIEYKSGELEPINGVVRSTSILSNAVTIQCGSPDCTIANVLLVPPLSRDHQVVRLAYAYSSLLGAPDGDAPESFPGDWATLYHRPPQGYPSALYSGSISVRWFGLAFGHLIALAGLLMGLLRR